MLLNIAKAYEMLQFGENKAYAHNEVISVLLRHAQRHSSKFLFWILSLELHKKALGSQNDACVFVKNEMNIFLLIQFCYSAEIQNLFKIWVFLFFSHQKQISNIETTEIHAACHTLNNLWTFLATLYQQREKKYRQKTKGFALMLASNSFINKFVYFAKSQFLFISKMLKIKLSLKLGKFSCEHWKL